jgi:hypothetical protein
MLLALRITTQNYSLEMGNGEWGMGQFGILGFAFSIDWSFQWHFRRSRVAMMGTIS